MRNTKKYLELIEGLDFKEKKFEFPVVKIYETFEDEKWIIGERDILQFFINRRFFETSYLRAESPWTIQGVELIEKEIQPIIDFFFLYPKVSLKAYY